MANKQERQATVLELVRSRAVSSQEELRKLLRQRGWDVTQATLSRDLRDLRLARISTPEGIRYAVPGAGADDPKAALEAVLPSLFRRVDGVGELVVLRTVTGGAQPIGVALDANPWPDILGTIAGDDTILIICRSEAGRERVVRRLERIARSART